MSSCDLPPALDFSSVAGHGSEPAVQLFDAETLYPPFSFENACARFVILLFRYNMELARVILSCQLRLHSPRYETRALLQVLEQGGRLHSFFDGLLVDELPTAASLENLFRDISPAVHLLRLHFDEHGAVFVSDLLGDKMDVAQKAYARCKDGRPLRDSAEKIQLLSDFIRDLVRAIDTFPLQLAHFTQAVQRRICQLQPAVSPDEAAARAVSACLLLHFLCPSLVDTRTICALQSARRGLPRRKGSSLAPSSPVSAFGTAAAKFLLQLANNSLDVATPEGAAIAAHRPAYVQACRQLLARASAAPLLDDARAHKSSAFVQSAAKSKDLQMLLEWISASDALSAVRTALDFSQRHSIGATVYSELIEIVAEIPPEVLADRIRKRRTAHTDSLFTPAMSRSSDNVANKTDAESVAMSRTWNGFSSISSSSSSSSVSSDFEESG